MRGTVHLLDAEDSVWMLPLFEPAIASNSRRRAVQLGLAPAQVDRALDVIRRATSAGEPVDRPALVELMRRRRIEITPERRVHIFRLAVAEGVAAFGPDVRGEPALVAPDSWLGKRPPHDRDAALAELARRYFAAFGPATEADFAGWAGLPLRDVRAGMSAIGGELRKVQIGNEEGRAHGRGRRPPAGAVVRLLPAWDTYLMGYRDRSFLAPGGRWPRIMPGGGMLKPAILLDGEAVGLWRSRRAGAKLVVELEPFERFDAATRTAIEAEVADLGRFEALDASADFALLDA